MQLLILGFLLTAGEMADAEWDIVALAEAAVVQFASLEEGREILTSDDAFSRSLSRFDMQCRLKTDKEVSLEGWKQFVAQHVRPWEKAEIDTVTRSLERV